jgi:hypothetical protein
MKLRVVLSVLFFLLLSAGAYSQCAMCKAAAESDLQNNPNSVAQGLNTGILFLMFIPYLIVGVIFRNEIILFFKNIRNKVTFVLTFVSCTVILFIIFISFYKPY